MMAIERSQRASTTEAIVSDVRKSEVRNQPAPTTMSTATTAKMIIPILPPEAGTGCGVAAGGGGAMISLPNGAPQRTHCRADAGLSMPHDAQRTIAPVFGAYAPTTLPLSRALPCVRSAPHCRQTFAVETLRAPQTAQ